MTQWNCLPVFSLCVAPTNRVQAIVAAPDLAKEYSQQIVETEHLFKALLEQPNGLARRILSKAGSDATRLLERTDAFVKRQAKVSGDAAQVGLAVLVAVDASCCKIVGTAMNVGGCTAVCMAMLRDAQCTTRAKRTW